MELLSGGEMIARALEDEGVEYIFGYPGGAVLHIYDALFKDCKSSSHIGAPRTSGNACGGWLRQGDRQAGRCIGDVWSRRNQCDYRHRYRLYGFNSDGCARRSGAEPLDWRGCLSGNGYDWHLEAHRKAQLYGQAYRRLTDHDQESLSHCVQRSAGPCRYRHP